MNIYDQTLPFSPTVPTLSGRNADALADVNFSAIAKGTTPADEIATVDDKTGAVTIVGVGTVTITAYADATDDFQIGQVSYTLTVINQAPPTYTLISSVDDLVSGGTYLIVSAYSKNDDASFDNKKIFKGTTNGATEDVIPVSGVITGDYSDYEFVISKKADSEDEYYLKIGDSYLTSSSSASTPFIVLSSSAASLKLTTEKTTDAPYREFSFAYKKSDTKPNETLYYSNGSSDNCFKVGESGYKYGVHLYKKD